MKTKEFRKLSEIEKRAILCGVIAKRTEGKMAVQEISDVVNLLDVNLQYTIKVISNAKEFAKVITLKSSGLEHSWAGSYGIKQEGNVLFGNVEFGLDYFWEYSNNGNMSEPDERKSIPDFNIDICHVVLIEENDWDHYNNSCNEHDKYSYTLYFYIPETEPYKINPKIQAIIEAFNIK